jgi:hypothetical protein
MSTYPPASERMSISFWFLSSSATNGQAIGTLKKEDFELFDKGKPQSIAKFSIEKSGSQHVEFEPEPDR